MGNMLSQLCGVHEAHFHLKVEDVSIFVGLSVSDSCNQILMQQDFNNNDVFQYGHCARPAADSLRLVSGQLAALCDRSVGQGIEIALRLLSAKFRRSGYTSCQLRGGTAKFTDRSPYLRSCIEDHFLVDPG